MGTFASKAMIDRRSPVPFYFQLKGLIAREIQEGVYAPGARLPSEGEMCEQFQVSRATVRQALGLLENEGLIHRSKGRGTFVSDTRGRSWLLQSSEGFFHDEVDRMGHQVTSKVLRHGIEPLPAWAATALGLPEHEHGLTVERLRYVDGKLALYVVNHLPERVADAIEGADIENRSLYDCLAQRGLEVFGGRRVLEAVSAGERLARLLDVERNAPLVFIQSVSWDAALQPFDTYQAWLRTDRMKIEVQVASTLAAPAPVPDLDSATSGRGA